MLYLTAIYKKKVYLNSVTKAIVKCWEKWKYIKTIYIVKSHLWKKFPIKNTKIHIHVTHILKKICMDIAHISHVFLLGCLKLLNMRCLKPLCWVCLVCMCVEMRGMEGEHGKGEGGVWCKIMHFINIPLYFLQFLI